MRHRTVAEQEAERQRIARELHDRHGQSLTLPQLGLDSLARSAPADSETGRQAARLKAQASGISREVNRPAWEIRPTALDDLGLQTALRHLIDSWSGRCDLAFDLHLTLDGRRLPPAVETTLYRVTQGAITNVVRHAEATRVGIIQESAAAELRLIVEDDGRGLVPEAGHAPSTRLGMLGMRERLSLVGDSLEVESSPGGGTTLFARVPL